LSQWALLTSVSKLGGAIMVGQLALALAISSPVFLFTNLQLSTVQTTDTFDRFIFADYFALRLAATGLGIVAVIVALGLWPQSQTTTAVTLLISAYKAFDSVSDIIYGFFRKYERMDLITLSQLARGTVSVVAFTAALLWSSRLTWAAGALALAGSVTLMTFDFPMLARLSRTATTHGRFQLAPHWSTRTSRCLVGITLPLGVSAMLVSLNANLPRYFISHVLGEESLGFFAGATYVTMAGTFVVSAVAQAVLPRLAHYYKAGNIVSLKAVLLRLCVFSVAIGVAGILLSFLAGRQILSLIYRPEFAAYSALLTLAACAATVAYAASVMNCAMNAVHRYSQQLPIILATGAATSLACLLLVPSHGLHGAALAMIAGYGIQLGSAVAIVANALRGSAARPRADQSHA